MTDDLARVQFASTSIYHFLFVPVTIGLGVPGRDPADDVVPHRATPSTASGHAFFGTLLVINVAVGVVTGLVQEFEFGMNWSAYSRFVGDVFGAPLAMEGLAAFFLESTFLGLWLFGWDRLPKRIHLACIWLVAFGAVLSAAFIMAANSWMQHPVGYKIDANARPMLNNIVALFTNPVVRVGLRPRAAGVAGDRIAGHAGGLGVAPPQGSARSRPSGARPSWRWSCWCPPILLHDVRRQPPRGHRDQVPADEDRRRRGAVEQLPAVLVLPVPDRRRQQRRDARPRSSPSPTCCPLLATGTWNGAGHRAQRRSRPSTSSSTARATTSRTSSSSTGRCG